MEKLVEIRTFNEEVEDKTKIEEIRNAISAASRVIFLGFHFHSQNMDLIKPLIASSVADIPMAYATAFHRSSSDLRIIKTQIVRLRPFSGVCVDKSWDCAGIFREFGTTWLG